MTKASPELLAISRRWYKAVVSRQETELRNFLSEGSELRFVGSAGGELWLGPAVREGIGKHFKEVPNVLKKEEILGEAFEVGGIGWSFFAHRFWFEARGEPFEFRTTLVFVIENGSWKIVHRHASLPIPNETSIGHKHAAIQDLLEAAQDGFKLGQTEGLASIMFTDIVNSSPIAAAVGDRKWSGIVAAHFDGLRRVIESQGGQFVKSLGDGTMSSFASARSALTAARIIQNQLPQQIEEPMLSLRIGIHTGDVVHSGEDFFGTVVNKAARVTAIAGAGEICVSDVTQAVVGNGPDFLFSDPATVSLKGLEGDHRIVFLNSDV